MFLRWEEGFLSSDSQAAALISASLCTVEGQHPIDVITMGLYKEEKCPYYNRNASCVNRDVQLDVH